MTIARTASAGTLGPTLPAWSLHAALAAAVALAAGTVVAWTTPIGILTLAVVVIGVAVVYSPATYAPGLFLAVCALCVLANPGIGLTMWTFVAVFALHAVHMLAALSALIPRGGDVERAAIRPTLQRFVVVQAASQPLVLLAWALT